MFDFLAGLLAELYKLWPSYGGAIILFTALIMLVLSPLSIKSTRSMIAMQRVGPEVKKLQQKHKGDREALNREMMAFYQEHNINPFSSCLPLLLQIPVFFVLYQVLIGLTRRSDPGDPTSMFNPKYLEGEDTPLAVALRGTNEMMSFGMDLSQSAWTELRTAGLLVALPFIVLVALVVITAVVQQRQVQGRNPAAAVNPQQQMIAKVIPFIFVPISISLPAGVVIYFVVSNLVRIGQQALVTKLDFRQDPPVQGSDRKASPPAKASPSGNSGRASPAKPHKDAAKGTKAGKGADAGANGRARDKGALRGTAKGDAKAGRKGSSSGGGPAKRPAASNANGSSPAKPNGDRATVPAPRPRKRKRKKSR
jgi:YidC/Oxa1 family membrane protein insertase